AADVAEALRPFATENAPARRPLAGRAVVPSSRLPSSTPLPSTSRVSPAAPAAPPRTNPQSADISARLAGLRPARTTPAPVAAPAEPRKEPSPHSSAARPARSWDQKLGPVGIALIAVIAGAAAWLLSSPVGK